MTITTTVQIIGNLRQKYKGEQLHISLLSIEINEEHIFASSFRDFLQSVKFINFIHEYLPTNICSNPSIDIFGPFVVVKYDSLKSTFRDSILEFIQTNYSDFTFTFNDESISFNNESKLFFLKTFGDHIWIPHTSLFKGDSTLNISVPDNLQSINLSSDIKQSKLFIKNKDLNINVNIQIK